MVQIMNSPRNDLSPTPRRRSDDAATYFSRWLKVWVLLLTVVVAVVVGYLLIITGSLANINGNLRTADRAVASADGRTTTLPNQVDRINGALAGIDPALKPIPGQADEIIAALTSIDKKLTDTDGSLKETSAILQTVLGSVNTISGVLIDANDPGDKLGVQNIHHRVAAINGRTSARQGSAREGGQPGPFAQPGNLNNAEQDARNILGGLISVAGHLTSICSSSVGGLVATGGNC